ncbi:substrate-binding domain-containing protein [Novosphingobium sp. MMS21-SN21R]|uniref:substrate-binding domain-containing protein n=1 Tax=Novosphingobium sp. MMS21-SN21R TaxID=2969298 RepID=UPI0028869AD3|nr:substrate-binding domain-containing protein [Novosphingobium sp. MMS21-SN21R]MDT0508412.1 substrate-binding domain-containing protein [Novosphingobium sp. MMS21-SN21R]
MKTTKLSLLAASMLASTIASGAQAQAVNPGPDVLHGVGASSITYVLVQDMNCLSANNPAGNNNNTTSVVPEGNYLGVGLTPKPLDCATTDLQPNNSGLYVATGSGDGRKGWRTFASVFGGSKVNPFDPANNLPAWSHYQFAFSDGPISQSDQTTFVASSATNKLGNAIQIPLFALPVALAYNPVYGRDTVAGKDLKFNVKSTYVQKDAAGNPVGGLRMNRTDYCEIFNGVITDWTDAKLKTRNGGLSLLDPTDPRGVSAPTPIRLVGRSDSSGTTDIFTRHLAAVCGADVNAGGINKFNRAAGGLPWESSLNMVSVDGGTVYTGSHGTGFANATNDVAHQSLSGAYYNKTTGAIVTTLGVETAGKFMIANGTSGVAGAINLAPDRASTNGVLLNGKLGYTGSDFVAPAPLGTGVFSVALQVGGAGTVYAMPNATNGAAAFGASTAAILPPQSIASSGAYSTADTRTIVNPTTGLAEPVDRANPLHWTGVLYANPANTLAAPVKGYAITGVTMMLPYQCYANANTRLSVNNLIALIAGKATKEAPLVFDANAFISTSKTGPGINVQSGIAPMPAAWRAAIAETFLKSSTQLGATGGTKLGQINVAYDAVKKGYYTVPGTGNGLWIQSVIPTSATTVASAKSNANCTPGMGA